MTNKEAYERDYEELEQYRGIGTVEECQEAVDAVKCLANIWEEVKTWKK